MPHVRTTWNLVALGGLQGRQGTHTTIAHGSGKRKRERGMSGLNCVCCMLKAQSQEHQYSEVGPLRKLFDQKGSDLISRLILA